MRNYFRSGKIILWVGLVLVIYLFAMLATESGRNYNLRSKSDELEGQIARLESQIEDLGYKVTYYKTDAYKERLAREKLNVAAPGEQVIVIKDDKANQVAPTNPTETGLKTDAQLLAEKSNFDQWRAFLFGN